MAQKLIVTFEDFLSLLDENSYLECVGHEGIVLEAYKDVVGEWTWSVGLTGATGHNVRRYIKNPATMQRALQVFVWAYRNYARKVYEQFKGHVLTTEQATAAMNFHWNTGAIAKASWVKAWKGGNMQEAERRWKLWNKPAAIRARRAAGADLMFRGIWSHTSGLVPQYTRVRANGTIDWSSRKMVDIRPALQALRPAVSIPIDQPMQPDAPVDPNHSIPTTWVDYLWQIFDMIARLLKGPVSHEGL